MTSAERQPSKVVKELRRTPDLRAIAAVALSRKLQVANDMYLYDPALTLCAPTNASDPLLLDGTESANPRLVIEPEPNGVEIRGFEKIESLVLELYARILHNVDGHSERCRALYAIFEVAGTEPFISKVRSDMPVHGHCVQFGIPAIVLVAEIRASAHELVIVAEGKATDNVDQLRAS